MKWQILILTQPSRDRFLQRLLAVLKPQVEELTDVEIVVRQFDRSMDLGRNRQAMIDSSTAEYICFVDDDDLVPFSYVPTIYPLLDGIDYIGFQVQLYVDGEKQRPTFHSLKYDRWWSDDSGYYRDISHLNPMRRELAIQAKMSGGFGEDQRWCEALAKLGIVKTEHYIDQVMYYYLFRNNKNDRDYGRPTARVAPIMDSTAANFHAVGHRRPECPRCGSTCCGMGGGMRICNQCGAQWS